MMRLKRFIAVLFIFLGACVDPLKIKLLPETQKFVVDGLITNDPGPYEVKLSYSLGFDNTTLKKPPLATGASVWIYDNFNTVEKLTEISPGSYQTSKTGIRGIVGREYYIRIKTKSGSEYQSAPQQLENGGEIKDVSFQFQNDGLASGGPGNYVDALKILLDATGNDNGNNLFRWRWNTIFKAETFPGYRLSEIPRTSPVKYKGAPEPCSGYVSSSGCELTSSIPTRNCATRIAECTCCVCWPYGYNTAALISHNRIIDGHEFKNVDLGNIPATAMQFHDKYYFKVEQLSLSDEAYAFWNLVEKQQAAAGSLFQPNSAKVRGNIQSTTDPDEEVLGLFGVSGIARKEMYITTDVMPYKLPPIDTITHDCSNSFQNVYASKPTFW